MKLFSGLKKLVALIPGKKKAGNAYLKTELHIPPALGENGKFKLRSHRLEKLKRRILAGRRREEHTYSSKPPSSKKIVFQFAGVFIFATIFLLLWTLGGKARLYRELQSIAFFKVSDIELTGCSIVSRDRVFEASGVILHQTSLFGLNISKIENGLVSVPWVERAVVKRNWPSTIEIEIDENVPMAILHIPKSPEAQLQYIDANGVQILPVSAGSDIDFPVITGIMEIADEQLREKSLAEVLIFLKKVQNNDPHLPAQSVSEVHVNQVGEIVVYMVEYPFPIFFGNGNTRQKYSRLIQVLRALYKKPNSKELLSQIEYIQMDYLNDKVLVAQGGSGL